MMKEQLATQPRPAPTRAAPHSQTKSRPTQSSYHHDEKAQTASPHRAGFNAGLHPECTPYTSSEQQTRPPAVSRMTRRPTSVAVEDAETLDDGALYPQRRPTSVRRYWPVEEQGQPVQDRGYGTRMVQPTTPQTIVRYHQRIPARSSRTTSTQQQQPYPASVQDIPTTTQNTKPQAHSAQAHRGMHWLVYVGLTLLAAVALYVGSSVVLNWWHLHQDDVTYGRPRTYQCDARVGHHDAHTPSHFIALNLHKHLEIIEFPGGDATKAHVYIGPTLIGDGQDLTPVTLTFADVNGDGKPDMLLHIGTQSTIVYLNDNGSFRPATANDHITL